MERLGVGLTYDLRDDYLAMGFSPEAAAEFDSVATIDALDQAIASLGHEVDRIGNVQALCRRLVAGDRWDLVFNIAEGVGGRSREAHVPSVLEAYGVPYTFSDPLACALTLDKALAKRLVAAAGLNTARFAVVGCLDDLADIAIGFPAFAKPNAEGTGKGVDGRSRVETEKDLESVCGALLQRFGAPVLVEEYLPGREFTVGVLGTGGKARALGTMEIAIRPEAAEATYSYDNKEKCEDLVVYSALAAGTLREAVEELALHAYRVLECRDGGRVDVRLDRDDRPSFLEVNPLPGLHPHHSDLPMIATQEGMPYARLLGAIIQSALDRLPNAAKVTDHV